MSSRWRANRLHEYRSTARARAAAPSACRRGSSSRRETIRGHPAGQSGRPPAPSPSRSQEYRRRPLASRSQTHAPAPCQRIPRRGTARPAASPRAAPMSAARRRRRPGDPRPRLRNLSAPSAGERPAVPPRSAGAVRLFACALPATRATGPQVLCGGRLARCRQRCSAVRPALPQEES